MLENKKGEQRRSNILKATFRNNTIILMKCGIGKVNAAAGTVHPYLPARLCHQHQCMGGIDSCLKIMDAVR